MSTTSQQDASLKLKRGDNDRHDSHDSDSEIESEREACAACTIVEENFGLSMGEPQAPACSLCETPLCDDTTCKNNTGLFICVEEDCKYLVCGCCIVDTGRCRDCAKTYCYGCDNWDTDFKVDCSHCGLAHCEGICECNCRYGRQDTEATEGVL